MASTNRAVDEVFPPYQAPEDHKKCGEGDGEEHAEHAVEGGAPEKDSNNDHDWMETSAVTHDFWRQIPAFYTLDDNDDKDQHAQHVPATTRSLELRPHHVTGSLGEWTPRVRRPENEALGPEHQMGNGKVE